MLDTTTQRLFSPFPREVGNPARSLVRSPEAFENFIRINNGKKDCYVAVYAPSANEGEYIIDKIFYEFDGSKSNWQEAVKDAKHFYSYMVEIGEKTIPVISGKKGFHFHQILRPKLYKNAKELLAQVTLSIITRAFNKNPNICFDTHPVGDVRRICRIPNTLRPPENLNYCTYLPFEEFLDMNEEELALHMKKPQTINLYLSTSRLSTLDDFEIEKEPIRLNGNGKEIEERSNGFKPSGSEFLKRILRPCLYNRLIQANPSHAVRVASTVDLLRLGMGEDLILRTYQKLNWLDWNEETTSYQISSCKKVIPYGCKKLRGLGIPKNCCVG